MGMLALGSYSLIIWVPAAIIRDGDGTYRRDAMVKWWYPHHAVFGRQAAAASAVLTPVLCRPPLQHQAPHHHAMHRLTAWWGYSRVATARGIAHNADNR